jgi:hypothetical protein
LRWAPLIAVAAVACGPESLDPVRLAEVSQAMMGMGGGGYFQPIASLSQARSRASAVLTCDGTVWIIGGTDTATLATTEIYDPLLNRWRAGPSLPTALMSAQARMTNNCNMYVVGGTTDAGTQTRGIEQLGNGFVDGGRLVSARSDFTMSELPDHSFLVANGQPVLTELVNLDNHTAVAGATLASGGTAAAEVGRPNGEVLSLGNLTLATFPPDAGMPATQAVANVVKGETLTLQWNGNAVAVGGVNGAGTALSSGLAVQPTGGMSALASLMQARTDHGASLLPSGAVWVVGGASGNVPLGSTEELVDGGWVAGPAIPARTGHSQVMLPEGQVLIAGGGGAGGTALSSVGVLDESYPTATPLPAPPARASACGAMLPDGRFFRTGSGPAGAELFDPGTRAWNPLPAPPNQAGGCVAAVLHDGRIFVAGGNPGAGPTGSAALYDFNTGSWTPVGPLAVPRTAASAILLSSGAVLVAGGFNGSNAGLASAELFEPGTRSFVTGGTMLAARGSFRLVRLDDDTVLAIGGLPSSGGTAIKNVDRFTPQTHQWSAMPALNTGRAGHSVTMLSGGELVVVGGTATVGAEMEWMDANRMLWAQRALTITATSGQLGVRLPFNRVLIAGGGGAAGTQAARIDPYTPAVIENLTLPSSLGESLGGLLPDGTVLAVGSSSAVIYDESRIAPNAPRPQLDTFGPVPAGSPVVISGSQLYTDVTASGGGTRASPSNLTLLLFRHTVTGLVRDVETYSFGDPGSAQYNLFANFSPGWYVATVSVNGITSNPQVLFVAGRCMADSDCNGGFCGADQLCCEQVCAGVCISGACIGDLPDGGVIDAGTPDAGMMMDAGMMDAGMPDAGPMDAGSMDAGPQDAGPEDAGADAGQDGGPDLPPLKLGTGCSCSESVGLTWVLAAALAFRRQRRSLRRKAG